MDTTLGQFADALGALAMVGKREDDAAQIARELRARNSANWTMLLDDTAQPAAIAARAEAYMALAATLRTRADAAIDARAEAVELEVA